MVKSLLQKKKLKNVYNILYIVINREGIVLWNVLHIHSGNV